MLAELPVPFVDASATALTWSLDAPRRAPLAGLSLPLPGGALELAVLGSSHQAILHGAGAAADIVETVACDVDGGGLPAVMACVASGSRYRFSSQVESLAPAEFTARVHALVGALEGRSDAVVARFPGGHEAVTALLATVTPRFVRWRTWHAYPQNGELVTTATAVERR